MNKSNTNNFLASSIGTAIAEVATIPLCTIKTNYQTNLSHTSFIGVTKNIYASRGIIGFYDATPSAIASQILSTATKYTFYSSIKNYRGTEQTNIMGNIFNGMLAGIFSSFFTHPFDVIKITNQQGHKFIPELKKHGVNLFYRGYSKSVSKSVLLTGSIFPVYDFYRTYVGNVFLSAICSSLTISIIIQPIDYIKVRHVAGLSWFQGFNVLDYYRGSHLNLLRSVPHFMITMYLTEEFKKRLNRNNMI
mgnify:CR=1 FL=1